MWEKEWKCWYNFITSACIMQVKVSQLSGEKVTRIWKLRNFSTFLNALDIFNYTLNACVWTFLGKPELPPPASPPPPPIFLISVFTSQIKFTQNLTHSDTSLTLNSEQQKGDENHVERLQRDLTSSSSTCEGWRNETGNDEQGTHLTLISNLPRK